MGRNAYCMRFRPVPSEGESFMASKQKILIVDDDNNIAELISLYLTKECYDTKIVNDGEEAVREFHSFQPNLILLDLMLPGMDGYQVCREIRHDSDVPIIMLSAKGEVFDKVLGLELGADDYIIKPFDSKELVARVKAVLRRFQPSRTIPVSATPSAPDQTVSSQYPDDAGQSDDPARLYRHPFLLSNQSKNEPVRILLFQTTPSSLLLYLHHE